jgi:hypothetical protein
MAYDHAILWLSARGEAGYGATVGLVVLSSNKYFITVIIMHMGGAALQSGRWLAMIQVVAVIVTSTRTRTRTVLVSMVTVSRGSASALLLASLGDGLLGKSRGLLLVVAALGHGRQASLQDAATDASSILQVSGVLLECLRQVGAAGRGPMLSIRIVGMLVDGVIVLSISAGLFAFDGCCCNDALI